MTEINVGHLILNSCFDDFPESVMPKDHWKKARDVDHAKRAKLERAVGSSPSYDYVWEIGSGDENATSSFGRTTITPQTITRLQVKEWLEWLKIPGSNAKSAQEKLNSIGFDDIVAVPALLDSLGDMSICVRHAAIEVLVRLGKHSVHPILQRLPTAKVMERESLIKCLAGIGEPAWAALTKLLNHNDKTIQASATLATAAAGVPYKYLWNLLLTGSVREKQNARVAFINGGAKAIRFLLDCLEYESLEAGLLAISILGESGSAARDAIPILIEITKNADDYKVQAAASKAWNAIRQDVLRVRRTSAVSISLPLASRQKNLRTVGSHVTPNTSSSKMKSRRGK